MALNFIQKRIISWYNFNKRDLPWRDITDPYKIWLSEIILQQTKVNQGLSYYIKFVETFPEIKHLALASEDSVLKLWQGLGYYTKARNLHAAAKQIHQKGKFPNSYKKLLELRGVGEYTAAAIASFAFNETQAVVDGNVFRVLSRVYGITTAIDSSAGKKEFSKIANQLLVKSDPALWNQAIMEFGALQCVPKSPNCSICPLLKTCEAFAKHKIKELPVKKGKTKKETRFIYYLFLKSKGNTLLIKRPQKGIWGGLYEFPNLELSNSITIESALALLQKKLGIIQEDFIIESVKDSIKHILSHRILHCAFIELSTKTYNIPKNAELVSLKDLEKYPVSRLIEKYLNES